MSIGEFWAGRMSARDLLALVVRLPAEGGAFHRAIGEAKARAKAAADDAHARALIERAKGGT